jgi:sugar phosphate isomerase/epimerase
VSEPRFSISQITTFRQGFDDDLRTYAAAGVDGIGLWELKLPDRDDAETLERVRASGLTVTNCVPLVPSILPMPGFDDPADPTERVESIRASIRRFAVFEPASIVVLTGAPGNRQALVGGLRAVADEGVRAGVPIALEPMQPLFHGDWTHVTTIEQALELIDEAGVEGVGVLFDTWHVWNDEDVLEDVAGHVDRIAAVHVNDWREPTRSWADRVLPGEGSIDLPAILRALHDAGWRGWYDLEIFSDDGSFGHEFQDSIWKLDPADVARRCREAFLGAWGRAFSG